MDKQVIPRFLIADSHSLVRSGLKTILSQVTDCGAEIVEADSFDEAMSAIKENKEFDLVVIDTKLPDCLPVDAVKKIRECDKKVPVVLISSDDQWDLVFPAFRLGASGFIPKTYSEAITLNALRLILSGGVFIPYQAFSDRLCQISSPIPASAKVIQETIEKSVNRCQVEKLAMAPRQRDILKLMLTGQSNKEIARSLGLALGTVKNQVAVILRVLNANNRSQAILNAIKVGVAGDKMEMLPATSGRRDY